LDRLERMILRRVARDYFRLVETEPQGDDCEAVSHRKAGNHD
jgi:hypothetical protein